MASKKTLKPSPNAHYGWIPDRPDPRDLMVSIAHLAPKALPSKIDLSKLVPFIYDQGALGSCTANAICGVYTIARKLAAQGEIRPSRLFLYYNERVMLGTVNSDSGAYIRDGIKSINKLGIATEACWPYVISKFKNRPSKPCYDDAVTHKVITYERVPQNLNTMKQVLASGFPFVFGFTVFESFESAQVARTGLVPMPRNNESMVGGHAVYAVGYDDTTRRIACVNSWGKEWGKNGLFFMPYEYISNLQLANDFWVVKSAL